MDYQDYLEAKRYADDRSLNANVLQVLRELPRQPRHVLELGAGTGTLLRRLHGWRLLSPGSYTLLDRDEQSLARAHRELTRLGAMPVEAAASATLSPLRLRLNDGELKVHFFSADVETFIHDPRHLEGAPQYDALFAHAVLDLFDVDDLLPRLWPVLSASGIFWFTLNFDGLTELLPAHPHDAWLLRRYHASMDRRDASGRQVRRSQTGRRLLQRLLEERARVVEAGASDWVVLPRGDAYRDRDGDFLQYLLQTIEDELRRHPEVPDRLLDDWLSLRRSQLARGRLGWIVHQIDVIGEPPRALERA